MKVTQPQNPRGVARLSCIAVVATDPIVRQLLFQLLQSNEYTVWLIADCGDEFENVLALDPDAIFLDTSMRTIGCVSPVSFLRSVTSVPILMVATQADTKEKVESLRSGADDYLTNPFVYEEVNARLKAHLRRPQLVESPFSRWRKLSLDHSSRELRRESQVVTLTFREFALFKTLMREPMRLFSKEGLVEDAWGCEFEGSLNVVEQHISDLRAKLQRIGETEVFIRTVRGIGYGLASATVQLSG